MSHQIPTDDESWRRHSQTLQHRSIHDYESAASGSKIKRPQFLLLRIIWKNNHLSNILQDTARWINPNYLQHARHFLYSDEMKSYWQTYLNSTSYSSVTSIQQAWTGLGAFSLVRYHQLQSQGLTIEGAGTPKLDFSPIASRTRAQTRRIPTPTTPTRTPASTPAPTRAPAPASTRTPVPASTPASTPVPAPASTRPSVPASTRASAPASTPASASLPSTQNDLELASDLDEMRLSNSPHTPSPPATPEDYSSPFVDPSTLKDIQDEQIVNTALIDYLNSLAIPCKELTADWKLHRLSLIARNSNREKTYEARVDGYLERRSDRKPLVILEVKPCRRFNNEDPIRMQESAQMAAWISQYPPRNLDAIRANKETKQRLLISQDRHQIYLTFARFDADYVDYICHKTHDAQEVSSLVMHEFGPFDVGVKLDMERAGELILGYALEACHTM
ncbi:hypothetical protein F5Y12DRAFT_624094 [Xylaria sp. FL1777]|nr:hypothetical protein F5Y12DRAFT_624094 [Xylaria sp. FL1777]